MMFGSEIYGTRKLKMAPPSFFVLIFGDKNTPELQVEPLSVNVNIKMSKSSEMKM